MTFHSQESIADEYVGPAPVRSTITHTTRPKGRGKDPLPQPARVTRCSCAFSPRQSNLEKWPSAPRAAPVFALDATALVPRSPSQKKCASAGNEFVNFCEDACRVFEYMAL